MKKENWINLLETIKSEFDSVMNVTHSEFDANTLIEKVKAHPELPISCFIDGIDYGYENGTWYENKNKYERLSYAPLYINVSSPCGWFMFYGIGEGWNIDNDIENAKAISQSIYDTYEGW